ncbi:vesicle coat component [Exophiala xenobiotica]|nr:vesicle coat component [Exophiala xenobiotica]
MASANHIDHGSVPSDASQTGHWLPALRPEVLDESHDFYDGAKPSNTLENVPAGFVNDESHIIPPATGFVESKAEEGIEHDSSEASQGLANHTFAPEATSNGAIEKESGTSFAGDELPSEDDDERLDPAWGIKRQDSARILQGVHRTSTFPEVATSHTPDSSHENGLVQRTPETQEPAAEAEHVRMPEQEKAPTEPQEFGWMDDERDGTRDAHSWTVPEQSPLVDEAAQRFDEGVPLMQDEEPLAIDENEAEQQSAAHPFGTARDDEEISYFSHVNGTTDSGAVAPSLDRKSTTQVLDSMEFQVRGVPESPAAPDAPEAEESSFFHQLVSEGGDRNVSTNEAPEAAQTQDPDAAAWAAVLDDDEFLVEDADDLLPDSEPGSPSSFEAALQQGSSALQEDRSIVPGSDTASSAPVSLPSQPQRQMSANQYYAPHQPSTSDMLQLSPTARTTHNNIGISRPELAPMSSFQSQMQQRPAAQSMKSFVDQAKDGYKSPYDLPMEISKPRKRAHVPQPVQISQPVAPPPRSSSLSDKPLQSPFSPTMPSTIGGIPPPAVASTMQNRSASVITPSTKPERPPPQSASSSFFEELPMVTKPRPASGQGRYTPQQNIVASPPQLLPQSPPRAPLAPPQAQPSPPRSSDPYAQYQLQAPVRLDPYANAPLQPPAPSIASNSRYSPAPPTTSTASRVGPSPRYSPVPPPAAPPAAATNRYASQPTPPPVAAQAAPPMLQRYASQAPPHAAPPPPVLPFQPRTSSPLAYHKSSIDGSANLVPPAQSQRAGGIYRQVSAAGALPSQAVTATEIPGSTDGNFYTSPANPPTSERMAPPRRSQTQSPSKQRPPAPFPPYVHEAPNRPASAYGQPTVHRAAVESMPPSRPNARARGFASDLEFVRPIDEAQFDPLERWKGAPVLKFGFGGSVVSTFPKHVPRYAVGAARPQIKATPGDVSVRGVKDILPQPENINTFPGPLRAKAKKKDVLAWMSDYITALEATPQDATFPSAQPNNDNIRHHEKLLLWRIVRTLVEHDGVLDGPALKAVNLILAPEVHAVDENEATQYRADDAASGIYRPSGTNARPESVDPMAVEVLRKRLLSGDRQAAVFHAMDHRLWSHALIISSTMERSYWSQVVREFVRQEVKTVGENTESLSALYEVFGGNLEESIDELVPPSARAGLQMVSKVDSANPTKNALDGLNRWRETLSLVLNNRCQGDHQALAALGKLLEDYNRIEAAHICYLFSRNPAKSVIFGGGDEEQPVVLLGVNHKARPFDFGRDQEAIVLTEIYEFATSVLAPGALSTFMPHLSVYKLQRAKVLADGGQKQEAQAYCDAIAATFKSNTKMSLYHHSLLLAELDDLSTRLKQTPMQGSSSWLGKPSLEKVSGSMWNKFSSFVAGDDSDAESKGSGKDADAGPFANVTSTPSISRTGSQSDLYGGSTQGLPATGASSRYAPNGINSARSSSELTRARPSLDSQRSPPSTSYSHTNRQQESTNMLQQGQAVPYTNPYQFVAAASPPTSYPQSPPRSSSYVPNSSFNSIPEDAPQMDHQSYVPTPPAEETSSQSLAYNPGMVPTQYHEDQVAYGGYGQPQPERSQSPPQHDGNADIGYNKPSTQSYGYEPPAESGYVPYVPEPGSPEEERRPKKKSFMDDDDDDFPRISSQPKASEREISDDGDEATRKRANDAAAEAAFRAAAEADAAREKEKGQSKRSSSWFGGWLGGKKPAAGLDAGKGGGAEPKIYKAKLGESKMKLYYDKDLGKWVNPDNPDAAKKTATPPPPRMGGTPAPPSSLGGPPMGPGLGHTSSPSLPNMSMGPPSGPVSRTGTPGSGPGGPPALPGMSGPPSGTGTPPPGLSSTPGLAPPRPGTAASNASSIDDLIGPATSRKPGAKGAKKGKRYVDVMAK